MTINVWTTMAGVSVQFRDCKYHPRVGEHGELAIYDNSGQVVRVYAHGVWQKWEER